MSWTGCADWPGWRWYVVGTSLYLNRHASFRSPSSLSHLLSVYRRNIASFKVTYSTISFSHLFFLLDAFFVFFSTWRSRATSVVANASKSLVRPDPRRGGLNGRMSVMRQLLVFISWPLSACKSEVSWSPNAWKPLRASLVTRTLPWSLRISNNTACLLAVVYLPSRHGCKSRC